MSCGLRGAGCGVQVDRGSTCRTQATTLQIRCAGQLKIGSWSLCLIEFSH